MDGSLKTKQSYLDTGQKFLSEICRNHEIKTSVPSPLFKNISSESAPEMRKFLDENLGKDIPTGIAYCRENLQVAGKCPVFYIGFPLKNNFCPRNSRS